MRFGRTGKHIQYPHFVYMKKPAHPFSQIFAVIKVYSAKEARKMALKGTLENIRCIDIRSGFSSFTIAGKELKGVIPPYPDGTPVIASLRTVEIDLPGGKDKVPEERISEIRLFCDDIKASSRFLSTFKGIGPKAADALSQITNNNIFSYIRKHDDLSELHRIPRINEDALNSMTDKIKDMISLEDLYLVMFPHGGVMSAITTLFDKYGDRTIKVLKENPYVYFFSGGDYVISECLAKAAKIKSYDKKRVHALVYETAQKIRKQGNTRASFEYFVKRCRWTEEKAECGYKTDSLFIAEELKTSGLYRIDEEEDGKKIYVSLEIDGRAEDMIAENLKRLAVSGKHIDTALSAADIEKELEVKYGPEQKEALNGIEGSGVYIITGGPGTGKTTLLKGLLKKFSTVIENEKTALCAPTGCAARRMSDATGKKAQTVHRLLDVRPYEKNLLDAPRNPLPYSLIILDEASMLDAELFAAFLSAVKNGTLLILMGDKDQLPSVEPGNVLSDLIECGALRTFSLKTVFRQKNGATITDNAGKIINGKVPLTEDKTFIIRRFDDEKTMKNAAFTMEEAFRKSGGSGTLKIFTPVRKRSYECSTIKLNQMIKSEDKREIAFRFGLYEYSIGEKIMFTKNNYDKGYYNGQEGIIRDFQRHGSRVLVSVETDDGTINISGSELSDIEPCYVITAHKSQGSECDYSIILVPKNPGSMLLRKILYVEVTRAKKQVVILSEGKSLETAVLNRKRLTRETGLVGKLKKALLI